MNSESIKILCILEERRVLSSKILLAIYGILRPKVQWYEIPSVFEIIDEIQENFVAVNINKTNKVKVLNQIEVCKPNIIIFAGTFMEFEISEMQKAGWDISYSAKLYVNDDQLGDTTAFYITSPTKLCIEASSSDDYRMSDKTYWYEMKKAVELWKEFQLF